MRAHDIIRKKRDGLELSCEEIAFLVEAYTNDKIPDYQISAFLMAVYFRGMAARETTDLTDAMLHSGRVLDLSAIPGFKVDKHSTGGVGDKTSLVIAPIVAVAGVPVPMISGRGLGHSGGTLDKLESIPGFNVNLTLEEFQAVLKRANCALIGQTKEIAPADKRLYALRDVTATIESIPLISASIMSKKLAEGIDGLVLDVKTGSGAFMKKLEDSRELARTMVSIGTRMGKRMVALVTDMDQPLGREVGNSLEVIESLETLKGRGPADLTALCLELAAWMLLLAGAVPEIEEGRARSRKLIESGKALAQFREIVNLQGGRAECCDDYLLLPTARARAELVSPASGYVARIQTEQVGLAAMLLGAGRERLEDRVDHAVGVTVRKKVGDRVQRGEPLVTLHYNDEKRLAAARDLLEKSFEIQDNPPTARPLVLETIR